MSQVTVRIVETTEDREAFLDLPWRLYADEPHWIPPSRDEDAELAGFGSHPFFEAARTRSFLATVGGKHAGRITAVINETHNQWHRVNHGFFGFFECINNREAAFALFDAARRWLAAEGCQLMRGPASPSITYQCGLLIDGFNEIPTFMMPYNPSYYPEFLNDYGFSKCQDLLSFVGHVDMLESINPKIKITSEQAIQRLGIEFRNYQMTDFSDEIKTFYDLYHRSLTKMWGFTPVTSSEVDFAARSFAPITVPDFTVMAEIDGEAVGTVFGLLDFNPLIQSDGDPDWSELAKILTTTRRPKRLRIPCALVLPQYALWGVGPSMLQFLLVSGLNWGIEEVEFSWISESNWLSKGSLERGGARRNKTYRMYDLKL